MTRYNLLGVFILASAIFVAGGALAKMVGWPMTYGILAIFVGTCGWVLFVVMCVTMVSCLVHRS